MDLADTRGTDRFLLKGAEDLPRVHKQVFTTVHSHVSIATVQRTTRVFYLFEAARVKSSQVYLLETARVAGASQLTLNLKNTGDATTCHVILVYDQVCNVSASGVEVLD